MPTTTIGSSERGFSLIELMIALVITLIVTGSMYGLLAQGQNAFRREPEISDRQQQIRMAMDLIQRDIATAGMGMPEWTQAFTPGLDGLGPNNADGVPSDHLEIIGYDGACMPVALCSPPDASGTLQTSEPLPGCYRFPTTPMLLSIRPALAQPTGASLAFATDGVAGGACATGEVVTLDPQPRPPNWEITSNGAVLGAPDPDGDLRPVQVILYRIYEDAPGGVPSLWRSAQGGLNPANIPGGPVDPGVGSDWQLVATGIEDLQVQYRDGNGAPPPAPAGWVDSATVIVPGLGAANFATITREVRVTLTARTTGQQILQGESVSATGVRAIRGQLTSVTTPRAALTALSAAIVPVAQQWN